MKQRWNQRYRNVMFWFYDISALAQSCHKIVRLMGQFFELPLSDNHNL